MLAEVVGRMILLLSSLFLILSFPKSLCSRLHPSLAGLIGCEIAFLPRLQQPSQRRDFPQRWWVAEPPRLLRPGREGVIDQTWREASWQQRSARPPSPGGSGHASALGAAGAHRPHVRRPGGCSCPFKAASARRVCVCVSVCVCPCVRVRCVRLWAGGGGSGERKERLGA